MPARRNDLSYTRFSDPKQSKGDSEDRQARDFRDFCQRHNLTPLADLVNALKGDALASLLQSPPFRGRAPLVLGDDLTDEPAFAMAETLGGVGVIVGPRRPTAARHTLSSPKHTGRWLAALASRIEHSQETRQ